MPARLLTQLRRRKLTTGVLLLLVAGGAYWGYGKMFSDGGAVRYATAQAQNGTFIVSTSGSGQVSASNQVDVKPKTNGEITALYAALGQEVGAGTILAAIDSRDAERALRDAETALETAKLELDKLLAPLDALTLLQAENSFAQAKESRQKAEDNLRKAYEDGFTAVANAFLTLPNVMMGLRDMLFSNTLGGGGQWNIDYYADSVKTHDEKALKYRDDASHSHQKARQEYDQSFTDYKAVNRSSASADIERLVNETYETAKTVAEAVKNANNLIQLYKDTLIEKNLKPNAGSETHLANLNSYTGTTNNILVNLLSIQSSLKDSQEAIVSAERTIAERELSLAKTKKGPDDLDIRAKKIAVQQREDALTTARQVLADTQVRAPFAGVIAKVNAKKGDTASAGTAIATLVTKQKIAEVSLNEVDVAKVKGGQRATLTFDAVPDLTITGQVAEVDAGGTVSQGVVTYTVKIGFDTQDDRVKTAMSVSVAIITEAKPDVLLVPNSAVKSQGGMSYVEIVNGDDRNIALAANASGAILKNTLRRQPVEIGTAGDEFTEITSGLKEGDLIVTRTIQPTASQPTQQQSGGLRIPGLPGGGGGGGGFRGGGNLPR